jgi:hypothetical protein
MRTFYVPSLGARMWMPGGNATRPLAELLIDERAVRVRLRHAAMRQLFGRAVPAFVAPFSAVRARAYGRTVLTRGVLLTGPENRSVIFWCSKRTQETILDALAAARYHG